MISLWLLLALAFGLVAVAIAVLLLGARGARREGGSPEAARPVAARDADPPGDDPAP